jgi:hypothetical protein
MRPFLYRLSLVVVAWPEFIGLALLVLASW